jgi:hypothetical protein
MTGVYRLEDSGEEWLHAVAFHCKVHIPMSGFEYLGPTHNPAREQRLARWRELLEAGYIVGRKEVSGTNPTELLSEEEAGVCEQFIEAMAAREFPRAVELEEVTYDGGEASVWTMRAYPIGYVEGMAFVAAMDTKPKGPLNVFLCADGMLRAAVPGPQGATFTPLPDERDRLRIGHFDASGKFVETTLDAHLRSLFAPPAV